VVDPRFRRNDQAVVLDPTQTGRAAFTFGTAPMTLPAGGVNPDYKDFAPMTRSLSDKVWSMRNRCVLSLEFCAKLPTKFVLPAACVGGGFSEIAFTQSLLMRLHDPSSYSGRLSLTKKALGAAGIFRIPTAALENSWRCAALKRLQKREKLRPVVARQLAESTNHPTGLPIVAANGLLQRQRCQVVHESTLRAQSP
jgi:hypothetical protein